MSNEFCLFKTDKKRVIWEVTKYCNYHCKHCCASANIVDTSEEMNTKQCFKVLDELKEFGVKEIYFSGGEPFSREDILLLLQKASNNGIKCNISTNGSFLTENIAKELEYLNLNKVHISLDSNDEKDFNNFRGGNYFQPTVNAIKLLKKHEIYVRVGTVIWKNNVDKLEEIIKFLVSLGVDEVVFNWLVKVGRLVENNDMCVEVKYFDETINKIQKYMLKYESQIRISMHRHEKFEHTGEICPAGEKFFYISPKGFVSPCSWIKKMDSQFTSEKSLKEKSFLEIINDYQIQSFNKMKESRDSKYKTGCPAICLERNNTYYSKDPLLDEESSCLNNNSQKEDCTI